MTTSSTISRPNSWLNNKCIKKIIGIFLIIFGTVLLIITFNNINNSNFLL